MILKKELEGLAGPIREKMEQQITLAIKEATGAFGDNRPERLEHLELICIKSAAKIKSILELARDLQGRAREES